MSDTGPWEIGEKYFVRCATYHYLGRLEALTDRELVLSDASWVADSGRFGKALSGGEVAEVEPYPDKVILNREAVVDASIWLHALPRAAK